jgi:hypothetical protein
VGLDESSTIIKEALLLSTCGFQLAHLPTKVSTWQDKTQLQEIYRAELRSRLVQELGGNDAVMPMEFYHPMQGGEDLTMTTTTTKTEDTSNQDGLPQSPTASMAHIDTDIGASEAQHMLSLVESNRLGPIQSNVFPRGALLDAIQKGLRFMIINCRRNAGESPIQRVPLSIYAISYKDHTSFPTSQPDWKHSRWYLFPGMTKDECLLFKQYDRDIRFASDIWHCALHYLSVPLNENAFLRRSLDARAFVIMNERVDDRYDRYSDKRARPSLNYQESELFCRAHGVARQRTRMNESALITMLQVLAEV